jgi:cobalamin biosynthesis Mg chelatase CobN
MLKDMMRSSSDDADQDDHNSPNNLSSSNSQSASGSPAAQAYPFLVTNSMVSRRVWAAIAAVVLLFIFRNMLFTDYTNETRKYLTSVGKADVADSFAPKSYSELRQEKVSKDSIFDQMMVNITKLMARAEAADAAAVSTNTQTQQMLLRQQTHQQAQEQLLANITRLSQDMASLQTDVAALTKTVSSHIRKKPSTSTSSSSSTSGTSGTSSTSKKSSSSTHEDADDEKKKT